MTTGQNLVPGLRKARSPHPLFGDLGQFWFVLVETTGYRIKAVLAALTNHINMFWDVHTEISETVLWFRSRMSPEGPSAKGLVVNLVLSEVVETLKTEA